MKSVDNLLEIGTNFYLSLSHTKKYLLINELPDTFKLHDLNMGMEILSPIVGFINQSTDNGDALAYTLKTGLSQSFDMSPSCFFTMGHNPGYTIGMRCEDEEFFVMDSHSRNRQGKLSIKGKAVLMKVISMEDLVLYIKDLASSLSRQDMMYEITPIIINTTYDQVEQNDEPLEQVLPTQEFTTTSPDTNSEAEQLLSQTEINTPSLDTNSEGYTCMFENEAEQVLLQAGTSTTSLTTNIEAEQFLPQIEINTPSLETNCDDHTCMVENEAEPVLPQTESPPTVDVMDSEAGNIVRECEPEQDNEPSSKKQKTRENTDVELDISSYLLSCKSDLTKFQLINTRIPQKHYIFPTRQFKDKRRKSGFAKRSCCNEWFEKYSFLSYSCLQDGIYCLACVLFPDSSHRRPKKLISEPYINWKDAVADLNNHSTSDYHQDAMTKLQSFLHNYDNFSRRIDVTMSSNAAKRVEKNRQILTSVVKTVEICGRQGFALRGHRDDNTCESNNKGNFKALIDFRVDSGDAVLKEHQECAQKNATYISKTIQNEVLWCLKEYIQGQIVAEINTQPFGAFFGIQCDEVRDSSNWEQLGLVVRFVKDGVPKERLLEFVACEETTGEALCDSIVHTLTKVGLNIQNCRSQTMDGAGNMTGCTKGVAARITQICPKAIYHYCSSHDLNMAICKSCDVKEVKCMLEDLVALGIFYHYSPKRSRKLEAVIASEIKAGTLQFGQSKMGIFCKTRWVEKFTTLDTFFHLYDPIIQSLEAIAHREIGWTTKAMTEANGLLMRITSSLFIASFITAFYFFGYLKGLSVKLQGNSINILSAYDMVDTVKSTLHRLRGDDKTFTDMWKDMEKMAQIAGLDTLRIPRRCGRQTQRSNVPAESAQEYYRRAIILPFLDSLVNQLDMRFNSLTKAAVRSLVLIPMHTDKLDDNSAAVIFEHYSSDLPDQSSFNQEIQLWKNFWSSVTDKPSTLEETVNDTRTCVSMFPNVCKILFLVQLTSVTSASTERANSSLKFVKCPSRSTMGEDRLNALLLLYIHKDIKIDYNEIVNMFANKNPRRMILSLSREDTDSS